ncbi:tail fibers protein [Salmonella phage SS9]|uniref:Tail fibers protein n=2 Tax=Kuttervirus SS9 TaxID=2846107 RepID=A0A5C0CEE1_9CAUD|nr:tail fiber protein [Salmonella phage SS9]QEI24109.1 tail fibers protein [Salmonella phage SS3]QEI24364.1 tail fibers protein [Salmonella phage SS9]
MTRNVEELFGGVVTAPHQIPFTYKSNVGGETFLSLPFYPVTGVITINGGMQVPLDNFEIEGNTLNLGRALSKGDVVYCLFDKILSPEDTAKGIRIYKFQAVGGETEFTPDFTSYGVQSLYIGGEYKTPEIEYSYSSTTGKVSLQTALTAGVWVVAEMSVKQPNISPAFDRSIQEIARSANVKDSEVIVSTDTISLLDGKKVVYDIAAQTSYGLPTIPDGSVISSVSNGQLTYNPGNITVSLLPAPYPVQTALDQYKALISSKQGTANIGHSSPAASLVERSLQMKLSDIINIKDFGAIGDGLLHPLSEKFNTLSAAQMVYPFVTDLNQSQDYAGTQAAINAAKAGYAVFAPSGKYEINHGLVADYALCMYGEGAQGLRTVDATMHSPSPVRGTVFNSHVATGRMLSIDSGSAYCFGMTLRDFAIWGVDGQCDVGLYINGVGWMGIVKGINIQFFPNQALEIGYIQDTYFTNCSFLQSGSVDKPAVTMIQDSNYVYFTGCHFELTPYMIKCGNPWFLFFNHCHFEVARPVSTGSTPADRFVYTKAPIDLGTSYRVFFCNNVFIPTDVGYLATKLSVSRKDVPYFITGSGSVISFTGDTFLAPEGTIKSAYLSGTDIDFNGVKFIRCDPSDYGLFVQNGKVANCSYGIDVTADTVTLCGIKVPTGSVTNTKFGFYEADSNGQRTAGGLLVGGAHCSGNELPIDARINIYADSGITVNGFDGGKPFFVDVANAGDIDLTKIHPAANLRITGAAVSIFHIYGAPYGRDLIIASNTTDGVIKYAANNIIPKGSVDFAIPQYHHTLWRCINDGSATMYQIS